MKFGTSILTVWTNIKETLPILKDLGLTPSHIIPLYSGVHMQFKNSEIHMKFYNSGKIYLMSKGKVYIFRKRR